MMTTNHRKLAVCSLYICRLVTLKLNISNEKCHLSRLWSDRVLCNS